MSVLYCFSLLITYVGDYFYHTNSLLDSEQNFNDNLFFVNIWIFPRINTTVIQISNTLQNMYIAF